jgi:integrase/recombinase XerD
MTLQMAASEFVFCCIHEKQLSSKTIKAYEIDLKQALSFLDATKNINKITKHELRLYIQTLSKLKAKSIKRKIATLKAMFNYFELEDKISLNPFRKLKIRIKEPQILRLVLDIKEVNSIFDECNSKFDKKGTSFSNLEAIRNMVVFELLFNTGARVSEIANLKMDSINLSTGIIRIDGKGNKERYIRICHEESLRLLNEYYVCFKILIEKSGGWFLVNRNHRKLSDQSIRNMVSKISKSAGIERKITPHVFRHTFATLLLEKNVDLKYIQSFLGHSSIVTTQIYTHVNTKHQDQILSTMHPRKDFKMLWK